MDTLKVDRRTPYEDLPSQLTVEEYRAWTGQSRFKAYEDARRLPVIRYGSNIRIPKEVLLTGVPAAETRRG